MEQLHVRDGWRKNGLGSDPESQDESGKNWASEFKRGTVFNKEGVLAVLEAIEKKDKNIKPKPKTFSGIEASGINPSHILI